MRENSEERKIRTFKKSNFISTFVIGLSFCKFSYAKKVGRDERKDDTEDEAISAHLFRVNIRHLRR